MTSSCAKSYKFPVSTITPASEMTVEKKKDKNNNYNICVKAKNLANPERLSPSKKMYIVWYTGVDNTLKKAGLLNAKNGGKTKLETVSATDIKNIFVTAENDAEVTYPSATEISRITF